MARLVQRQKGIAEVEEMGDRIRRTPPSLVVLSELWRGSLGSLLGIHGAVLPSKQILRWILDPVRVVGRLASSSTEGGWY